MFPTAEKYRINGQKNSRNTRYYYIDGKRLIVQEIAERANCHIDKARKFLNQYNMPPEKFIKLMLENKNK